MGPIDSGTLDAAVAAIPLDWWNRQRWFGGKGRGLRAVEVVDAGAVPLDPPAFLVIVSARYSTGPEDRYFLPLVALPPGRAPDDASQSPAVTWPAAPDGWRWYDALGFEAFRQWLLAGLQEGGTLPLRSGVVQFHSEARLRGRSDLPATSTLLRAEQSNSAVVFGEVAFLKCFRRVVAGVNPDLEVSRFLTVEAGFRNSPEMLGSLAWRAASAEEHALGVAQAFVPSRGSGWDHVLSELRTCLAADRTRGLAPSAETARRLAPSLLAEVRGLGALTGELHLALASSSSHPDFAPTPLSPATVAGWQEAIRRAAAQAHDRLAARAEDPPALRERIQRLLGAWSNLQGRVDGLGALGQAGVVATRIHGDYHLGQLLACEAGYQVIDFEGEPLRSLDERRARLTPLKDVAGMLRSLAYAAHAGLREGDGAAWGAAWEDCARQEFLAGYRQAVGEAPFLPRDEQVLASALVALEVEKALYELAYELDNRPDWLAIPLDGLTRAALA